MDKKAPHNRSCVAGVAMALLALAIMVLVPSGYMVSAGSSAGLQIVVCSGHGSYALDGHGGQKAPADKAKGDAPCAFAGVGAGPAPAATLAGVSVGRP